MLVHTYTLNTVHRSWYYKLVSQGVAYNAQMRLDWMR